MAVSNKRPRESEPEGKRKRGRYKFESFEHQVAKLKVPHFGNDVFGTGLPLEDADEVSQSCFNVCLQKWRDLNLSESFVNLARQSHPLCRSLVQVVYNKEKVVEKLKAATETELESGSELSLEPILDLWHALAKDLQQDFVPFFDVFLGLALKCLGVRSTEVIKASFTSLSGIMKIVQRGEERTITERDIITKVLTSFKSIQDSGTKLPKTTKNLIGVALAHVVRRAKDKKDIFKVLFEAILSEPEVTEVVHHTVYSSVIEPMPNVKSFKLMLSQSVIHLTPDTTKSLWLVFVQELLAAKNFTTFKDFADEMIKVEKKNLKSGLGILLEIIPKRFKREPISEELLDWTVSIMNSQKDQNELKLLIQVVIMATNFKEKDHKKKVIEITKALFKPQCIMDFEEKCDLISTLDKDLWCSDAIFKESLNQFSAVLAKDPEQVVTVASTIFKLCEHHQWDAKWLEVPNEIIDKLCEAIRDASEDLVTLLRGLIYIGITKPKALEQALNAIEPHLDNPEVLNLVIKIRKKSNMLMKCEFVEKMTPKMILNLKDPFVAEAFSIVCQSQWTEQIRTFFLNNDQDILKSIVDSIFVPQRDVRIACLKSLVLLKPNNAILSQCLKAEEVDASLASYRDRLRLLSNIKNLDKESAMIQQTYLNTTMSNFFEGFNLLWKPTLDIVVSCEGVIDQDLFWSTVFKAFERVLSLASEDGSRTIETAQTQMITLLGMLEHVDEHRCQCLVQVFQDLRQRNKSFKLCQSFLKLFASRYDHLGKNKDQILEIALAMLKHFDMKTQGSALDFVCAHFKKVKRFKEALAELCDREKARAALRGLHEHFDLTTDLNVNVKSCLISLVVGTIKRTMKEKAKKQLDDRKFIVESCAQLSKSFLFQVLEAAKTDLEEGLNNMDNEKQIKSHCGMLLDMLMLSKLQLNEEECQAQVDDWIIQLLVQVVGDINEVAKQKSKKVMTMLKTFKEARRIPLETLQSHQFLDKCVAPLLEESEILPTKMISLFNIWLEFDCFDYFVAELTSSKTCLMTLLSKHVGQVLDILAVLVNQQEEAEELDKLRKPLQPLTPLIIAQVSSWLADKKAKRLNVKVRDRFEAVRVLVTEFPDQVPDQALVELVENMAITTVPLTESVLGGWHGAMEAVLNKLQKVPDLVFRCMSTLKQEDFRFKLGVLLQKFLQFKVDKARTFLEPYQMHDAVRYTQKEVLYAHYVSLAHINSDSLEKTGQGQDAMISILTQLKEKDEEEFHQFCKKHVDGPLRRGLRSKSEVVHTAFVALLQALVKLSDRGVFQDLKQLTDAEDEDRDFFENMKHLQLHRRGRAFRRLTKMLEEDKVHFSNGTIASYLSPIVSRYIMNPAFVSHSDLVEAAITLFGHISVRMTPSSFMKLLDTFISTPCTERPMKKQKFAIISKLLQGCQFNEDQAFKDTKAEQLMRKCLNLLKGDEEDGSLHVFGPIAKLAFLMPNPDNYVQTVIVEICTKMKTKQFRSRQLIRVAIADLMKVLGSRYLFFLISNLESILEKGYQKHVLVFSINHVLGVLNEANALDQAAVEAVTDKVLSNVQMELFTDFAKEKKVAAILKKTPEAKTISSFNLLSIVASHVGKEFVNDILQALYPFRTSAEIVQKIRRAIAATLSGMAKNPNLTTEDQLLLAFGILNDKMCQKWKLQGQAIGSLVKEFALNLVLNASKSNCPPAALEPLMPKVIQSLEFESIDVTVITMKIVSILLSRAQTRSVLATEEVVRQVVTKMGPSLRRYARNKDDRPFLLSCKITEKLLLFFRHSWKEDELQVVKTTCLNELERNPVACSGILSMISDSVGPEECQELVFQLCKTYVSCLRDNVVQTVKDKLLKIVNVNVCLDFMMQNFQYEEDQGRLRIVTFLIDILEMKPELDTHLLQRLFYLAVHRFVNEDVDTIRTKLEAILKNILSRKENGSSIMSIKQSIQEWSKSKNQVQKVLASKMAILAADIAHYELASQVLNQIHKTLNDQDADQPTTVLIKVNILETVTVMLRGGQVSLIKTFIQSEIDSIFGMILTPYQALREAVLELITETFTIPGLKKLWLSEEKVKTLLSNLMTLARSQFSDQLLPAFKNLWSSLVTSEFRVLLVKDLVSLFTFEKAELSAEIVRRTLVLQVIQFIIDSNVDDDQVLQDLASKTLKPLLQSQHLESLSEMIEDTLKKLEKRLGTETFKAIRGGVKIKPKLIGLKRSAVAASSEMMRKKKKNRRR